MGPLYYFVAIGITIILAIFVGRRFNKSYDFVKLFGFGISGFWLLWVAGISTSIVGYISSGPIAVAQTIFTLVVFYFNYRYMRDVKRNEILTRELRRDISQLDNKLLREKLETIAQGKVDILSTPNEHREKLIEVLKNARETVVVLSGWTTSFTVNQEFRRIIAQCLKRGVIIYIGYGYQKAGEEPVEKEYEGEARQTLVELQSWVEKRDLKGQLIVFSCPNHAKTLIKDDEYAINGSFNWLSNIGTSQNEERSWIVYNKEFVTQERDSIIKVLEYPLKPTKGGLFKKWLPVPPWRD